MRRAEGGWSIGTGGSSSPIGARRSASLGLGDVAQGVIQAAREELAMTRVIGAIDSP